MNLRGLTEKDFETGQNFRSLRCVLNQALPELGQKVKRLRQIKASICKSKHSHNLCFKVFLQNKQT
jgi:hypothetical protein